MDYDLIQINDLHLGAHNCLRKRIRRLIHKIKKKKITAKTLVICGDGLNDDKLKKLKHKDWKILKQLKKLQKLMKVIWVKGNHDPEKAVIEEEFGIPCVEELVIQSGDINVYITHGHNQDAYLNKHPKIVALADLIYNTVQFLEPTHTFAKILKKSSKKFIKATFAVGLGVAERAKELNCQKALHGHNHKAGMTIFSGIEVYDGGCFTEKPSTYLTLLDGKIEIHEAD